MRSAYRLNRQLPCLEILDLSPSLAGGASTTTYGICYDSWHTAALTAVVAATSYATAFGAPHLSDTCRLFKHPPVSLYPATCASTVQQLVGPSLLSSFQTSSITRTHRTLIHRRQVPHSTYTPRRSQTYLKYSERQTRAEQQRQHRTAAIQQWKFADTKNTNKIITRPQQQKQQ